MTVSQKITAGAYQNNVYGPERVGEVARLKALFKNDLLAELGLTNNPKADLLYDKAWKYSDWTDDPKVDLSVVLRCARDLAELLQ
jgi:hypothetical protein